MTDKITKTMSKSPLLHTMIGENDNYELWVADLPGVDLTCYAVRHKGYGVVEMSTSVLANAKRFHEMLNRWELSPPEEGGMDLPDMPDIGGLN